MQKIHEIKEALLPFVTTGMDVWMYAYGCMAAPVSAILPADGSYIHGPSHGSMVPPGLPMPHRRNMSACMVDGEEAMGQEDWKEKCMVLEALLMKFRMQIIKIRELTADKVGS
ncbi:hypothetical protein INR49_009607, partial [Caranx melampygus]